MIGNTQSSIKETNFVAVKGRVEIFELVRKYYQTLTDAYAI